MTGMTGSGHEDQFRPPSLNGRYRLGEATFAWASGNDEVAPKAEIGCLIDDLIGTGENGLRHRYAQRFGCLPVGDHFQIPFTR